MLTLPAILLAHQLDHLTNQGYHYSQKLQPTDQALIDTVTTNSDRPDPLPSITSIHSQADYNQAVKQLWTLTKDYCDKISFQNNTSTSNTSAFNTEQGTPTSNQQPINSDTSHLSESTEEIPHDTSLPPNQFPNRRLNMTNNNSVSNMTQDQLDQLVDCVIARALAAQQHQPGPSGSLSPSGPSEQNGIDGDNENGNHGF